MSPVPAWLWRMRGWFAVHCNVELASENSSDDFNCCHHYCCYRYNCLYRLLSRFEGESSLRETVSSSESIILRFVANVRSRLLLFWGSGGGVRQCPKMFPHNKNCWKKIVQRKPWGKHRASATNLLLNRYGVWRFLHRRLLKNIMHYQKVRTFCAPENCPVHPTQNNNGPSIENFCSRLPVT